MNIRYPTLEFVEWLDTPITVDTTTISTLTLDLFNKIDYELSLHVQGLCDPISCEACRLELRCNEYPPIEELKVMYEAHKTHHLVEGYPEAFICICGYCKFEYDRMVEVWRKKLFS